MKYWMTFFAILLATASASAGVARNVVAPAARGTGRFVAEVARGEASLGKLIVTKSAAATKKVLW